MSLHDFSEQQIDVMIDHFKKNAHEIRKEEIAQQTKDLAVFSTVLSQEARAQRSLLIQACVDEDPILINKFSDILKRHAMRALQYRTSDTETILIDLHHISETYSLEQHHEIPSQYHRLVMSRQYTIYRDGRVDYQSSHHSFHDHYEAIREADVIPILIHVVPEALIETMAMLLDVIQQATSDVKIDILKKNTHLLSAHVKESDFFKFLELCEHEPACCQYLLETIDWRYLLKHTRNFHRYACHVLLIDILAHELVDGEPLCFKVPNLAYWDFEYLLNIANRSGPPSDVFAQRLLNMWWDYSGCRLSRLHDYY